MEQKLRRDLNMGENLRKLRKKNGFSQEKLCAELQRRSCDIAYFHGADSIMLERYAKALNIPMITCPAQGATYQSAFETGLLKAKTMGAEGVCFGDIDIEENRQWEEERCKAVGLYSRHYSFRTPILSLY